MTDAEALALYDRLSRRLREDRLSAYPVDQHADIARATRSAVEAPTLDVAAEALRRWGYGQPRRWAEGLRRMAAKSPPTR